MLRISIITSEIRLSSEFRNKKATLFYSRLVSVSNEPLPENKIGLIYREELVRFYDEHVEEDFDEAEFGNIFADMEI
jgi:hypothetical protein